MATVKNFNREADDNGFFTCVCEKQVHVSVPNCPHCGVRITKREPGGAVVKTSPVPIAIVKSATAAPAPITKSTEEIVREMHAWLDEMVAKGNTDFAIKNAEANRNSVGKWGETWLAKHALGDPMLAEDVTKIADPMVAAGVVRKRAQSKIDQALGLYETALEVHNTKVGKRDLMGFAETEAGKGLHEAYNKARADAMTGYPDAVATGFATRIDVAQTSLQERRDAFALQQNMIPGDAHLRLLEVSPSYAADYEKLLALNDERKLAIARAQAARDMDERRAIDEEVARRDALQARAVLGMKRHHMTPAELELDGYIAGVAKGRGETVQKATVWAMENDERAQTLYQQMRAERAAKGL